MNVIAFFVLCYLCIVSAVRYELENAQEHFENFMKTYSKQYEDNDEKLKRYGIFLQNLAKANALNKENEHVEYGITEFSDITVEEFLEKQTCYRQGFGDGCTPQEFQSSNYSTAPSDFDWRSKGVVSKVKCQGTCGSCWAFSVIGNVESVNAIKTKQNVELSEQQLVDCDKTSFGCRGGYPEAALQYLVHNGVMSESSYPYKGVDGQCKYNGNSVAVKLSNCVSLRVQENELQEKLYQTAPLSIVIDAAAAQTYKGGIIHGNSCTGSKLNHAVLLVGYGTENGIPYWLIKNSWSEGWGEKGYFRVQRGVNCLLMMNMPPITAVM